MTSAEKFDTNIYGFAWFEATPCRDHVCEGASLQEPCHAVQDFSGVRNPKNLSTWRLRRFSAADNPGSGNGVGAEDLPSYAIYSPFRFACTTYSFLMRRQDPTTSNTTAFAYEFICGVAHGCAQ
ncbi:atg4 [Symbiodinium sp. CCMP2592]|nr:atg4 [Symbiodinium sp. CCMP2592]